MKVQAILPMSLLVSVALLGLMKIRKKEQDKAENRNKFEDVKLRVTQDVLGELLNERAQLQNMLEKTENEQKAMEERKGMTRIETEEAKGSLDSCQGGQKLASDELALIETEFHNLQDEMEKDKTSWRTEVETLKMQLEARSKVCNFLGKGSQVAASKLCSMEAKEAPKEEEPKKKGEAPKQEGEKAEASMQEEEKAVAPKQEEEKAVAPKQEEEKAEAPKQDEVKAEAPKQEEEKAEAPKQEEAKAVAPEQEEAKAGAPKQEEVKAQRAKEEAPKKEER